MTGVEGYRAFLSARDGTPDFSRRTLSRREAFFDRITHDPVRSAVHIDPDTYRRNLARRRPEAGLEPRMLWLLATAKANRAERFGVGLGELYGRVHAGSDPVVVHIALQEFYHTRILADAVAMFGLPVHAGPPPFGTRTLIKVIVSVPERWQRLLAGCGEMAGCVIFKCLRDLGIELFAGEPAVAARIGLLYDQILGDEIGHVGFIASQLGPTGRSAMRGLYRVLGRRMAAQLPELVQLVGTGELARRFGARFRLDEMVAALPGLAYAAAPL